MTASSQLPELPQQGAGAAPFEGLRPPPLLPRMAPLVQGALAMPLVFLIAEGVWTPPCWLLVAAAPEPAAAALVGPIPRSDEPVVLVAAAEVVADLTDCAGAP